MDRSLQKTRTGRWLVRAASWTAVLGAIGSVEQPAGAQTTATISMASPPATPQIVGTSVFASKPASPLLFTVGATGQSPLSFSATGLPSGVTLSPTGTLTGTTPAAGQYPIAMTVTNAMGTSQATITLLAQDTLAATPPMGWNSYDSFGSSVTEDDVMQAAQAQQSILLPAGYRYVVVDYLWFDPEDTIDEYGRYLPSTSKFPSATGSSGFTSLASRVHALGLNFGIHIMRGIPRSAVAANTPIANSNYTAAQAGNTSDACPWDNHMWGVLGSTPGGQAWYDSIFTQYASWGIDFVKVDDTLNPDVSPPVYHEDEVDAIHNSIEKTGRSIVLSLSPGPQQTSDAMDLIANANQWRMVDDFWDENGLSTLPGEFSAAVSWQAVPGLGAGHWPDADMLPLGYLGPRCPVHASGPTALSKNQQVTVMTLWSILPSPLIFGGNEPMLATDAWTIALLTNPEVMAVDQDPDAKEGKLLSQSSNQQIWTKDLTGGRKAVAFFNTGSQDGMMSVTLSALGMSLPLTGRDAWQRTDVTVDASGVSTQVPDNSAALLVLSPPQPAVPDAGAKDAAAEATGPGDAGFEGGTAQEDAAMGANAAGDGSPGSDGGLGTAPGDGGAGGTSPGSSGCSCRVAAGSGSGDGNSLYAFAAAVALAVRTATRWKRRPSRRLAVPAGAPIAVVRRQLTRTSPRDPR